MSLSEEWADAGLGYTLSSGRLFCEFSEFQRFVEELLGRPVMTHEFADKTVWDEARLRFEVGIQDVLGAKQ